MLQRLHHCALKKVGAARVADVRVGLVYTAVMLDDGNVGLAYTFRDEVRQCCTTRTGDLTFADKGIAEILAGILSPDPLERTIGIAAANAVLNRDTAALIPGDVLDLIELRHDDSVGMVGYFGPLVAPLKKRVRKLLVFEQKGIAAEGIYAEDQAPVMLPECTVALITATTIINNTFEQLIHATRSCRMRVVLGPSTPLCAEAFTPYGISLLSGVLVSEPPAVLRIVSGGGGMQAFKHSVRKVNLKV